MGLEDERNSSEITLPSGAILTVKQAPFSEANNLFRACTKELVKIKVDAKAELNFELLKDLFCTACSSEEIDRALWTCMRRCLYEGEKITPLIFEAEDKRQDFLPCEIEVFKANILPFQKGLFAVFGISLDTLADAIPQSNKTKSIANS